MTTETQEAPETAPAKRRLLFNKTGMAYILKPAPGSKERRTFKTQSAIEPLDEAEEKFLLDYKGVVYADTIMQDAPKVAELQKELKQLRDENAELRDQLKGSLAAGAKSEPASGQVAKKR
jgi:hypothetical protein